MSLNYEVKVEGLVRDGHPHQLLFSNFHTASKAYDELCEKHPHHDVHLAMYQKTELKFRQRKLIPPPTSCPRGHSGETDGRSIITKSSSGYWYCSTCGDVWANGD